VTKPYTSLSIESGIAKIVISSPPVNALSAAVRRELLAHLQASSLASDVRAIILTAEGHTFSAGADIKEFGKVLTPTLYDVLDFLESSGKPVIAALNGAAAGGGLEIALACNYRVAAKSAKLSLPEVKLGLLPAGGGTQRLPRLIGVEMALDIMTSGRQVAADEALTIGIVDAVFPDSTLLHDAMAFALSITTASLPRVSQRTDKLDAARSNSTGLAQAFLALEKKFRGAEAPRAIARCVQAALEAPIERGLMLERQLFKTLLESEQSKALQRLFFAERQAAQPPVNTEGLPPPIHSVGVVGAGTMGTGIAMSFLNAGFPVTMIDVTPESLERGKATITRAYQSSVQKGRQSDADAKACVARLTTDTSLNLLSSQDLIIEAVFEDLTVKKSIFSALADIARPDAILATNTSYLDVSTLAAETRHPECVIGLHFFSPANIMKLVEVVRTDRSAPTVVAAAMALAKRLSKIPVLVENAHGFVGNRMSAKRLFQARSLIVEGATPWEVDSVFERFGFPMGPFAMLDLAGLDIGWSAAASRGASVAELLCEQGRRGQKTGAGYYDYDDRRQKQPSPLVEKIIRQFAAGQGIAQRSISDQEILERCLYSVVNEGAKILAEAKVRRATDIDVAWVHGFGWPAYKGGPMYWADSVGLSKIVTALENLEQTIGGAFTPEPLLKRLADEDRKLSDFVAL